MIQIAPQACSHCSGSTSPEGQLTGGPSTARVLPTIDVLTASVSDGPRYRCNPAYSQSAQLNCSSVRLSSTDKTTPLRTTHQLRSSKRRTTASSASGFNSELMGGLIASHPSLIKTDIELRAFTTQRPRFRGLLAVHD